MPYRGMYRGWWMESKSCSLTASLTEEGHDADGASAVVSPCRRPTSNRQLPHASYMKPPSIEPKVPPVPAHDLAHVLGFFQRLGLHRVVRPLPAVLVWSIYVFVNGFMTIAVLGVLAVCTGVPFVFPSLG